MQLDAKTVAALELGDKTDVIYFDDALPGFGYRLRLGAGRKVMKSWVCQYRRAGGSRRTLLGAGEVLSAEQARQAAKKVLAKVELGGDPQGDKASRRDKDKLKVKALIAEYLELKRTQVRQRTKTTLRAKTLTETQRYLTGSYFRPLHALPLDGVTQKDVALCLRAITRNSGEATMALARGKLNAFFVWCMQEGLITANPVIGTRKPEKAEARDRILMNKVRVNDDYVYDYGPLAAVWRACKDDSYGRIIKLLVLTGCRRGEVGGMAWSEIDSEREVWTIPSARSKNHRKHELPIMPLMAAILADVPRMATRDQLFGSRGAGFSHWAVSKSLLDERSGVTGWTVHDIRRTVATGMANLGVQPHVVEAVLNHFSGHRAGVAGTYNRSGYEREVKTALAQWHDHVRSIVAGGERKVLSLMPAVAG